MRFPPIVSVDESLGASAPKAVRRLSWPAISALVSAILGALGSLAGCEYEKSPPATPPTPNAVKEAPMPDDGAGAQQPGVETGDDYDPGELPNMDEAREEEQPPPGG